MPKSYTIRDVARKAAVGIGTVSRVLNDSPQVSEVTRQKVLEAIQELDFQPNPVARRLSTGKTLAIGVIVPFFTRPVFVGRLEGIEATLAPSDYDLILYNVETPEQYAKVVRSISAKGHVDGLIIMSLGLSSSDVERFKRSGIRVVLLDTCHAEFTSILIDDVGGGRQATRHLVDLGHSQIAFICDSIDNAFGFQSNRRRLEGYQSALADRGIKFRPEYHKQGDYGRHSAYRQTQELLSLDQPPTAILATSDTLALGCMEAIQQKGLKIPEDISVVGYDDIEVSAFLGLTTVRQPKYQGGVEAVTALLEAINEEDGSPTTTTLPTQLMVRETTGPPAF